jgi:acyl dehydratase
VAGHEGQLVMDLSIVGREMPAAEHAYDWKDCVLYALGVGAKIDELDVLAEARGPRVLPTFAVVPSFASMGQIVGKLGGNPAMIVHGEQAIRLHRPIPPRGRFSTTATVTGIYDKGKGALAVVLARTTDEKGEPVFDNTFSIFFRGAGNFDPSRAAGRGAGGGDRGPEVATVAIPERAPDVSITERTTPEQAALYRLSGDYNPLHVLPEVAKAVGFDRPILHGLCTYGYAGRAIVNGACGGDVSKVKSFSARFSAPVFPGDELTTEAWNVDGRWAVRVQSGGKTVLSHGVAEIS